MEIAPERLNEISLKLRRERIVINRIVGGAFVEGP